MNKRVIKVAASTVVIGATMVGCSSVPTFRPVAASVRESRTDHFAATQYAAAQEQFRTGNISAAIPLMEQAVEYSPRDAGYRRGLAELYLKNGRFASAETALSDVLAIMPDDSRAGFYLVLARLAQGKIDSALAQLQMMDASAAPADVGLAYALAGDSRRALALLEPAARAPTANGRVRQNLALAYALAGDWKKSQMVAAQDVSPSDLAKRMQQWAVLATPSASSGRVASLLGVTPATEDQGQPSRLALAPAPAAPAVALASADPAPVAPVASPAVPESTPSEYAASVQESAPVPVAVAAVPTDFAPAAIAAAPVETAAAAAPAAKPAAPPEVLATYVQAARTMIDPAPAKQVIHASAPLFIRAKPLQYRKPGVGRYVVQLGAFSSAAQVERAWAQANHRYAFGNDRQPLSTTVNIPGKGVFHRLSVAGFNTSAPAQRLCQSIKARRGVCFVRTIAGDAPVQWASRYTRKA